MSLMRKLGLELRAKYNIILKKLSNIKGTPSSISKGFATGVAMSFTPFVGFHILLSLIMAKLTKQNGIAAVLGTMAGNPWTFPIIWYLTLNIGYLLLPSKSRYIPNDFKIFFSKLFHAIISLDFNLFIYDIWPIFLPMLVGCIPCYIVVWIITAKLVEKALNTASKKGDKNDTRSRV